MRNKMDATNFATNVREFKQSVADDQVRPPSWMWRQLENLGVIDMATSTRPPELRLNYSTALFYLTVIAAILGGFWFMHDKIATTNYEKGVKDTENRYLQKQLDEQGKQLAENERLLKLVVNPNEEAKKK